MWPVTEAKQINMKTIKELWLFIKERKQWWLLPIVTILLIVSILIAASASSVVSPFIYTIF